MRDSRRWFLVGAVISLGSAACGPGGAAKAVRAEMPTGADALGSGECTQDPWVVDLETNQRQDLKLAMKDGVAIVHYDCKELKVLRDCSARGDYGYRGTGFEAELKQLKDADDVKAELSGGAILAAKLSSELERGTTLDIAYASVGQASTTLPRLARTDLIEKRAGACKGATHFVGNASLGAFVMKASTAAKVSAAAEVLAQGGSAKSESSAMSTKHAGNSVSCKRATENDTDPVEECNVPVQLHLFLLDERPPSGGPPPPPRPSGSTAKTCHMGEAAKCETACKAGDGASCSILGYMNEKSLGTVGTASKAFAAYERGCALKNVDACTGLGYMDSKGGEGVDKNDAEAERLLSMGCAKGNGRACSGLGQRALRMKHDVEGAIRGFARGCDFGYPRGCFYAAKYTMQQNRDAGFVFKSYMRACLGEDDRGCLAASGMLQSGNGIAPNPSEAAKLRSTAMTNLQKYCDGKESEACEVLGRYYLGMYDKSSRQPDKALDWLDKACRGGQGDSCFEAGKLLEKGDGPVRANASQSAAYMQLACKEDIQEACKGGRSPSPPPPSGGRRR